MSFFEDSELTSSISHAVGRARFNGHGVLEGQSNVLSLSTLSIFATFSLFPFGIVTACAFSVTSTKASFALVFHHASQDFLSFTQQLHLLYQFLTAPFQLHQTFQLCVPPRQTGNVHLISFLLICMIEIPASSRISNCSFNSLRPTFHIVIVLQIFQHFPRRIFLRFSSSSSAWLSFQAFSSCDFLCLRQSSHRHLRATGN